jgi:hypothetical protein
LTAIEAWHGTPTGYTYRKCRCTECKAAHAQRSRDYRAKNPEKVRKYNSAYIERGREWKRNFRKANPDRERAYQKAYRDAHPEKRREGKFRRYGITPETYVATLATQGGGCAICGSKKAGGRGEFHVDHDHACCPGAKSCGNCVRGLLCALCNVALGAFRDDPELLRQAINYLDIRKAMA